MSARAFSPEERECVRKVIMGWMYLLVVQHESDVAAEDMAKIARMTLSTLDDARDRSVRHAFEDLLEFAAIEHLHSYEQMALNALQKKSRD